MFSPIPPPRPLIPVPLSASPVLVHAFDHWLLTRDGDPCGLALYERHYSCRRYRDGRRRCLFCGPGQKTVLIAPTGDALLVWRKFIDNSGQRGINCAVFRNEGPALSSGLIREGMAVAWGRWPGERLYTYVDPRQVGRMNSGGHNPGYCASSRPAGGGAGAPGAEGCSFWNTCGKQNSHLRIAV